MSNPVLSRSAIFMAALAGVGWHLGDRASGFGYVRRVFGGSVK